MVDFGQRFGTVLSNVNNFIQGERNKLDPLDAGVEDVGVLRYPIDSDRLSGHFIMFHIVETTPGSGTIDTQAGAQAVARGLSFLAGLGPIAGPIAIAVDSAARQRADLLVQNAKQQSIIGRGRKRIDDTRKALIERGVSSEELTRLRQLPIRSETVGSIVIYMPEKITTAYAFEYQGEQLRIAAAGAGLVDLTKRIIGGSTSIDQGVKEDFLQALGQEFGLRLGTNLIDQLGSLVGANVGARAFLEKNIRRVTNPHMQFLFRAVGQRSFDYTFNFIPQSREESDAIDNIIRTFKFFAHPEVVPGGRFHAFPAEFDIQYISREQDPKGGQFVDQENNWLNRVGRCYLKSISVDYSGAGVFASHKSHNSPLPTTLQGDTAFSRTGNPPTHITVTLSFSELETLNRQHILEGF